MYYHAYGVQDPVIDYTIDVGMIKRSINSTGYTVVTEEYLKVSQQLKISSHLLYS